MESERFLDQGRAAGLTEDPMWFVYVLELKLMSMVLLSMTSAIRVDCNEGFMII